MTTDRWRLFVAVPIGSDMQARLAHAVQGWRSRPDLENLRWADPATWHVTLLFLGATEPAAVPDLVQALEGVAQTHAPMRLATGGIGGFPSAGRARVAWYGVADPDRSLHRLADDVRAALAPQDRGRFRPHVTLARSRADEVDLRDWIGEADAPQGELLVDQMRLMRSHLGRGPTRHEIIQSIGLGVAAHV